MPCQTVFCNPNPLLTSTRLVATCQTCRLSPPMALSRWLMPWLSSTRLATTLIVARHSRLPVTSPEINSYLHQKSVQDHCWTPTTTQKWHRIVHFAYNCPRITARQVSSTPLSTKCSTFIRWLLETAVLYLEYLIRPKIVFWNNGRQLYLVRARQCRVTTRRCWIGLWVLVTWLANTQTAICRISEITSASIWLWAAICPPST